MFVRTVLGDITPDQMGITLPHEHILCDGSVWVRQPTEASQQAYADAEPTLDNLWWMRQYPNSNRSVVRIVDEDVAVREVLEFKKWGGSTIVELTCIGLGRDVRGLARIARRTGLNIVAACGFYIEASHSDWVRGASIDELADVMVRDIEEGVDGTSIRAGIIGELGISEPFSEGERRVVRAAARAQKRTGAAISVHTAAHAIEVESALHVADIIEDEGGDLGRVIMGHMDTTLHKLDYHRRVAARGCWIEFDLFGHEFFESENDFISPGDSAKTRAVRDLIETGLADQLLLSHDTAYKIQTQTYGGYGYAHLLRNILPRFRVEGVAEETILQIMTENPRRVIPIQPPIAGQAIA